MEAISSSNIIPVYCIKESSLIQVLYIRHRFVTIPTFHSYTITGILIPYKQNNDLT